MKGSSHIDLRARITTAIGPLCLVGALVVAPALTRVASAQTEEGQLFLSVLDESGHLLSDLATDEISIIEDGVKRRTKELRIVGSVPRLSVLVDNGNSTRDLLVDIRRGVEAFLATVPDGVEVEIVAFGGRARRVVEWTSDRAALVEGVGRIAPDSGGAKFVDALDEARNRYEHERENDDDYVFPHIVVIAGDGTEASNVNDRRVNRMVDGLYSLPATIHVLLLRTADIRSQDIVQSELSLVLTGNTRGQMETASVGGTIPAVLTRFGEKIAGVIEAQARQFVLVFERPEGTQAQQTQIEMTRTDARQVRVTGDGRFD